MDPKSSPYEIIIKAQESSEVLKFYQEHPESLVIVVGRLIDLKEYDLSFSIISENIAKISSSSQIIFQIIEILANNLKKITRVDQYILIFSELISSQNSMYENFVICEFISEAVQVNSKFPSKLVALRHFRYISTIFKQAESYVNYLNAIKFLKEFEEVKVDDGFIDFAKMCASYKREKVAKNLFCGLGTFNAEDIDVSGCKISNYNVPEYWNIIFSGNPVEFNVDFLSFLKKNSFDYAIDNGNIIVGSYRAEGFTSKIFSITNQYEVVKIQEKEEIKEEFKAKEVIKQPVNKITAPMEVKKKEFKNRFTMNYKKFKACYSKADNFILDSSLEERNNNRKLIFDNNERQFNYEKEILLTRQNTIDELSEKLDKKIEDFREAERKELIAKRKQEEEDQRILSQKEKWGYIKSEIQNSNSISYNVSPLKTSRVLGSSDDSKVEISSVYVAPKIEIKVNKASSCKDDAGIYKAPKIEITKKTGTSPSWEIVKKKKD